MDNRHQNRPISITRVATPPAFPPPPSQLSPSMDLPCQICALPSPPATTATTINHSLFHSTTRSPLYVHPSFWSTAHLDILRVKLIDSPPPTPAPPSASFPASIPSIDPRTLSHFLISQTYDHDRHRHLELISLVESAIEALPGYFSLDYSSNPTLRIGTLPRTTLSPFAIVSRSTLPFAALTCPTTRRRARSRLTNHYYCPTVLGPVQPSDVALLIGLAQLQQSRLPHRESYVVCVLASDESGMKLRGLQAEISREYLDALCDTGMVLPVMEVRVWESGVGGGGEKVVDVVRALGEVAVKGKKRKKRKGMGKHPARVIAR